MKHISRALTINLDSIDVLSDEEREIIRGSALTTVDKYLLWRRSCFRVAFFPLILCALFEYILLGANDEPPRFVLYRLDSTVLAIFCVLGYWKWQPLTWNMILLQRAVWLLAVGFSIGPYIFYPPTSLAMQFCNILPTLLLIPFSLQRAAVRLYSLDAQVFHVVVVAMLILPGLASSLSVIGLGTLRHIILKHDGTNSPALLLILASLLLVLAPWTYVINKSSYIPRSRPDGIQWGEVAFLGMTSVGIFLAVIWAFMANVFGYGDAIQFVLDVTGRALLTNVVATDSLISIVVDHWRLVQKAVDGTKYSRHASDVLESFHERFHPAAEETTREPDTPIAGDSSDEEDEEEGRSDTRSASDTDGSFEETSPSAGHEVFRFALDSDSDSSV